MSLDVVLNRNTAMPSTFKPIAGKRVEELAGLEHEDAVEFGRRVGSRFRAQVEVHHAFEVERIADGVEVDHPVDIELETGRRRRRRGSSPSR